MSYTRVLPEMLSRTPLFRDQPAAVLEAVGAAMRKVHFPAGKVICERGDPGDALYLIVEGRLRISVLGADGRELSFAHAVANDIFGEISVLDGSPRSAGATALSDVTAFSLSRSDFNALVDRHSTLARAVIRLLCARLREVSDRLEDIALLPLEARLARFFLNRLAGFGGRGPADPGKPRITLGMSQGELALLLGASRPKVNAALMALAEAGAITRVGEAFACDAGVLGEIAQREELGG
jgi:CRP/FNR family cyclic AMP-dependent transcriptional regulator